MTAVIGWVDPDRWDTGRGPVAVPLGCWQIQRLLVSLDRTDIAVEYGRNMQRGDAIYGRKDYAVEAARRIPYPTDGTHLALVVVKQGCVDLANRGTAVFLNWDGDAWVL